MTDLPEKLNLRAAERLLVRLPSADRDELLDSLVIAICCQAPRAAREILQRYIVEHEFEDLVSRLCRDELTEGEA